MCAICGVVSDRGELVQPETLEAMAEVMRHRGPDDAGVYVEREDGIAVGLAHRRLTIIDLSANGHQPMTNEDRTLWLTYNGEIYNHADLRRELLQRGHRYRSDTDSETILHAYEEWGEPCVERLRGMFAFALWDSRHRRLLLVRDRLGVKPLYYAILGRTLVFASEIKAILAGGWVAAAPALDRLSEHLMFGYLAGEETLFAHVRTLMPGHVLVWERHRATVRRYWDLRVPPDTTASEADLRRRCRELLEESVRLHLMSDVPLGVFLSGGVDSSTIAAIMARQVGKLKTFSIGFEAPYYSELPFAREVAQHIGAEHHEVVLTPAAFLSSLPRVIWHEDEPLWGAASVALYHLARLAAESVTVVLTGEGSDELFAGYDRYWMTALNHRAARVYRRLPRAVRQLVRRAAIDGVLPERMRRALGHTVINRDDTPESMILDNWFGVFTPELQRRIGSAFLVQALATSDVYATHRRLLEAAPAGDLIQDMLYMDLKSNLVELLMKQDQMSMAASIESRVPFLDHVFVEFAAAVPSRLKANGSTGKYLLRRAFEDYLPARTLHRQKQGFPVPIDAWLGERFLPHVTAVLLGPAALRRGWFRPDAVRELLTAHQRGRMNATREIWCLFSLELWARIFLDNERAWIDAPDDAWASAGAFQAARRRAPAGPTASVFLGRRGAPVAEAARMEAAGVTSTQSLLQVPDRVPRVLDTDR